MAQETDDPFEINDFTTASDWEKFISDLESLIRGWRLTTMTSISTPPSSPAEQDMEVVPDLKTIKWQQKMDTIKFAKVPLDISHVICRDKNGVRVSQDHFSDFFPSNLCPPIAKLFGLTEFIVISGKDHDPIDSLDKTKLLLSSASIALSGTSTHVPIFINNDHRTNTLFSGVQSTRDTRTTYDMIHLRKFSDHYQYLSNLSSLFKEKLGWSPTDCPPLTASIRFTKDFKDFSSTFVHLDLPIDWEDFPIEVSKTIDYVPYVEPISTIRVVYEWKDILESVVSESAFHSDLDPFSSQEMTVEVLPSKNIKSSMKEYIDAIFNLVRGSPHSDFLHRKIMDSLSNGQEDVMEVLDRLASTSTDANEFTGPVKSLVTKLASTIFDFDTSKSDGGDDLLFDHKPFKSCPFDCLTWRIGHCLAFAQISLPDPPAISFLWREIVRRLRQHFEMSVLIPGLNGSDKDEMEGPIENPDHSSCLLHQKLQMLNCCIKQKVKWSATMSASFEEDEFFDAEEEVVTITQPEGRLQPLKDMMLINSPSTPIYVPVCQDPTPMTDDMLHEQAEVMSKMTSTSERMRHQLPTLISDMEAFKAANPDGVLEDFVRWYSPRDYSDEEGLSRRFREDGNTWTVTWQSCKPLPVSRQKLLFDFKKEGSEVINYLMNMTCSQLGSHLLPIMVHSMSAQLSHQRKSLGLSSLPNPPTIFATPDSMSRVFHELRDLDDRINVLKSLKKKIEVFRDKNLSLPFDWSQVMEKGQLSSGSGIKFVVEGKHRRLLCQILENVWPPEIPNDILSHLTRKEYVLKVCLPRPSLSSSILPQRMYAMITDDFITISTNLTEDTTFM